MPRATAAYPFEHKVFGWANDFAARMTGDNARAFLMLVGEDGAVRSVHFSEGRSFDRAELERLRPTAPAHVFYDPFDFPVYGFLAWSSVARAAMERLTGLAFSAQDFVPARQGTPRPLGEFPSSWRVMF